MTAQHGQWPGGRRRLGACAPPMSAPLGWGRTLVPQPETRLREGRDHSEATQPPGRSPAARRLCPAASALPLSRVPGSHGGCSGPDSCPHPTRLFQVNVGPPRTLEELDPETREYWRLLRKHNIWRHNRLSKNRKF